MHILKCATVHLSFFFFFPLSFLFISFSFFLTSLWALGCNMCEIYVTCLLFTEGKYFPKGCVFNFFMFIYFVFLVFTSWGAHLSREPDQTSRAGGAILWKRRGGRRVGDETQAFVPQVNWSYALFWGNAIF